MTLSGQLMSCEAANQCESRLLEVLWLAGCHDLILSPKLERKIIEKNCDFIPSSISLSLFINCRPYQRKVNLYVFAVFTSTMSRIWLFADFSHLVYDVSKMF